MGRIPALRLAAGTIVIALANGFMGDAATARLELDRVHEAVIVIGLDRDDALAALQEKPATVEKRVEVVVEKVVERVVEKRVEVPVEVEQQCDWESPLPLLSSD